MKKIFTFFTAALFAASLWGSEITVGSGTFVNATTPSYVKAKYSICELLYTTSLLTTAGLQTDDQITAISFKMKQDVTTDRTWDIYMNLSTYEAVASSFDCVKSANLVFSGVVHIKKGWFQIELDKAFTWTPASKTKSLQITIYDHTESAASGDYEFYYISSAGTKASYMNGSSSFVPTSSISSMTTCSYLPVLKLEIGGAPTPTITLDKSSVNLGTFDAAYETVSQSFFVKGSDLTADVTISAAAGLSVDPSSITKEAIAAAGTTGVEVVVSNTSSFVFNSPKVTVSSTGADSKQVTVSGTAASYTDKISIPALKEADLNGYYKLTASATINSIEGQTMVISSNGTITVDFSAIGSSYQVFGKVTNVKGKLISADLFKAFSLDYTAPAGVTIDQDQDNSAILAENDGEIVNVHLVRSFTSGMYNTICLPFELNAANLELTFGNGYSLIELSGTSKDGDDIVLTFDEVTELESGKPYFIKPTKAVNNPSFSNKEISKDLDPIETTYADFIPVFSPTALESSKDILFLGANNELFWPSAAGSLKGLRCYFEMKNGVSVGAPVRMSIGRGTPTSNEALENNAPVAVKRIVDGQLIIERNGVQYDLNGKIIK